jgi:hypothetical protein
VHLDQLDQQHRDDIYHGAAPLEPEDRRGYFNEVLAMLAACSAPPSHGVIRNIIAVAQRRFNRSVGRVLEPRPGLALEKRAKPQS